MYIVPFLYLCIFLIAFNLSIPSSGIITNHAFIVHLQSEMFFHDNAFSECRLAFGER